MGTRQAGLPEFRVANLVRDLDILQAARKEAEYYVNQANSSARSREDDQARAERCAGEAGGGGVKN